jgi:hypothetical protein
MDYGMFFFILCLAVVLFVIFGMRSTTASAPAPKGTGKTTGSSRIQMVEDMKLTKTSRVVDQVAILDELEQTSPNFRQYCELVGTAQREGGVVAPYSRRQVAYYEIRCYRIENRGSGDVETLVAHEKSFDPFYFKDGSCDTPIYVDINSFGNNVMLINSTNHIEGPNSDFAKAVDGSMSSATSGANTYGISSIVGEIASGIVHGFGRARDAVVAGLLPRPAFAYATVGAPSQTTAKTEKPAWLDRLSFANVRESGTGGRPSQPQGGNHRGGQIPSGLGDFLDRGGYGGYSSVPRPMPRPQHPYQQHTYRRVGMGDVVSDMITGMVLSSVLDNMYRPTVVTVATPTINTTPKVTFRGYRLVEDVVPLGSPVYCIGEIYHHGTDVYMGRSLATDYPTSYFATRPETEVLASLGA